MNRLHRIRARAEQSWHAGRAKWVLLFATVVLTVATSVTVALVWQRTINTERALHAQVQLLHTTLSQRARESARTASAPAYTDFVQRLSDAAGIQPMLATLQRSSADAGVVFAGVQIQQRAATEDLLTRTDMTVSLRGAHPKLKQVLAELLGRYSNVTLTHLTLRRSGSPDQVEATLAIGVWGAPSVAPPASAASALPALDR